MAKILPFRKLKQAVVKHRHSEASLLDIEDDICAITNDCSLTPSNKSWILENMLMNMDDQLEEYKKELERAEKKLDALVKSAEREIADAYRDFDSHVRGMTRAVKRLTRGCARPEAAGGPTDSDVDTQ